MSPSSTGPALDIWIRSRDESPKAVAGIKRVDMAAKKLATTATLLESRWIMALNKIRAKLTILGTQLTSLGWQARWLGYSMRQVGMQIMMAGAMMAVAMLPAVNAFKDFNDSITGAGAALGIFGENTFYTSDVLGDVSDQVMGLGASYGFMAGEAGKSYRTIVQMGFDAAESVEVLDANMELARATGEDLAQNNVALVETMSAWGLEADSASQTAGILYKAWTKTTASIYELNSAIGFSSQFAQRFNMTLADNVAILGMATKKGISATVSGRRTAAMFQNLADNAKEYGLNIYDAEGNMLGFAEVVRSLEDKLNGMSTEQERSNYLSQIFGTQGQTIIEMLIGQNEAGYDNIAMWEDSSQELAEYGGTLTEVSDTMLNTFPGMIDQMVSGLTNLAVAAGESGFPQIKGAMQELIDYINDEETRQIVADFSEGFMKGFVETATEISDIVINKLLPAFVDLYNFFAGFIPGLPKVEGDWKSIGEAAGELTAKIGFIAPALLIAGVGLVALGPILSTAGSSLTTLTELFGGAITRAGGLAAALSVASPLLAGIAGVGIAVGLMAVAYAEDWGDVRTDTQDSVDELRNNLAVLKGHFTDFKTQAGEALKDFWDNYASVFIGKVTGILLETLIPAVNRVVVEWAKMTATMGTDFEVSYNDEIKPILDNISANLTYIEDNVINPLTTAWKNMWETEFPTAVVRGNEIMLPEFNTLLGALTAIDAALQSVVDWIMLLEGAWSGITNTPNWFRQGLSAAPAISAGPQAAPIPTGVNNPSDINWIGPQDEGSVIPKTGFYSGHFLKGESIVPPGKSTGAVVINYNLSGYITDDAVRELHKKSAWDYRRMFTMVSAK